MYELGRRNTKLPEVFVDKLYESMADTVEKCCSSENANSCLENKVFLQFSIMLLLGKLYITLASQVTVERREHYTFVS